MTRDDVARLAMDEGIPLNFTMYQNGPIGAFTLDEFMRLMQAAYAAGAADALRPRCDDAR